MATETQNTETAACRYQPPDEVHSNDPEVLRNALVRESLERKRAECLAGMQADVVQLALDLLVREPNIEGFFGGLTRTMVEEGEACVCAVWLVNEERQRCEPWMAYVGDRLIAKASDCDALTFPRALFADHIFSYTPGWTQTIEYEGNDARLPEAMREFNARKDVDALIVAPLLIGGRTLGWLTASIRQTTEYEGRWWRVVLIEAIARQAALALHHSRLIEENRVEERRKAILEERNRLARDIHDNLAQGFAAILMQLQAVRRDVGGVSTMAALSIDTVIDVARTHLTEARRSVSALRPNPSNGEDIPTALKRLVDMRQRTDGVPIDLEIDELPRFGDGVEREIIAIAQEALTNAVRHSRARRITIRASAAQSVGLRLSVADDGRGIARDRSSSGFGMTSMQERADRIGASLTIVTAPRNGTEVVLAWQPLSLPTQVHVAS